jgi:HAE1 family hydrophobic/amphiphilic exporter-1
MTSVAAIFGALPIALGLGAGAGSRRPLGYSIIGGLVLSTLLTLFLVPAVFVVFERLRKDSAPDQPTHGNGSGVVAGDYRTATAHEPVEVK